MPKKNLTPEQEQIARFAKALGHPIRVAIVQMLASQSCCYHGDMSEVLPVAKSTLSQHLNELKDAGLIQGEINLPSVKYCINQENWALVKKLFNGLLVDMKTPADCAKKRNINMRRRILILCTGNSCRSQMAEGYLQMFAGEKADVYSAGVETHGLNPRAVAVMKEDGVDISNHRSKLVDELAGVGFDYVITVCDNARERCPYFPSNAVKLHQAFPDPAQVHGTEAEIMTEFQLVRDMIKAWSRQFINDNL